MSTRPVDQTRSNRFRYFPERCKGPAQPNHSSAGLVSGLPGTQQKPQAKAKKAAARGPRSWTQHVRPRRRRGKRFRPLAAQAISPSGALPRCRPCSRIPKRRASVRERPPCRKTPPAIQHHGDRGAFTRAGVPPAGHPSSERWSFSSSSNHSIKPQTRTAACAHESLKETDRKGKEHHSATEFTRKPRS